LYTACYKPELHSIIEYIDGVHYTLHYPITIGDLAKLECMEYLASVHHTKSFRLYIEPRITHPIIIIPNSWNRIEVKPWLDECPLPDNEELFELDE
jgi:hypothetical protein